MHSPSRFRDAAHITLDLQTLFNKHWLLQKFLRNVKSTKVRKNGITILLKSTCYYFFFSLFEKSIILQIPLENLVYIYKSTPKYIILAWNQIPEELRRVLLPLSCAVLQSAAVPSLGSVCTLAGSYSQLHFWEREKDFDESPTVSSSYLFSLDHGVFLTVSSHCQLRDDNFNIFWN